MVQQNCRKRLRFPRIHSKAGTNRMDQSFQWKTSRRIGRVSTYRNNRWRWSPCRLLVDPRWLHLSASQWTSSSTPCAEGRNFACSTLVYWRNRIHSHQFGRQARKTHWRLLESRWEQMFVRFVDRFHQILLKWKGNLQKDILGVSSVGRVSNHLLGGIFGFSSCAKECQCWACL